VHSIIIICICMKSTFAYLHFVYASSKCILPVASSYM
jgi:hypothetical protein